jgi:hypothetical protein
VSCADSANRINRPILVAQLGLFSRVLLSTFDRAAFEEFRVSMYLKAISREFPCLERDEAVGPGYSSVVKYPTALQTNESKSTIDLSPIYWDNLAC